MTLSPPTDAQLQFYYFGFYSVLKRYRATTLLGWLAVAFGCASFFLAWNVSREHGAVDILLTIGCVAAGLGLVQNSVASLSSYVAVPFGSPEGEGGSAEGSPAVLESIRMMKEVEEGGWQEAYAAIRKLREMESMYDLPPLSR